MDKIIPVVIINDQEEVVLKIEVVGQNSFDALVDFMNGLGYDAERVK